MSVPSRREFLKAAAFTAGATGLAQILPTAIDKARAIDPIPGSTFWDAEHVVILMQENRSFDHAFGTLQGVRGFDDPRAITLPNGNPVWVQTNNAGQSYAPFRLDIKHTRSTWMGCLPHGWTDQVDARNGGRFDRWLDVKSSGEPAYAGMPLTMGYYNREDLPFYYALADAFTICDQNFCSTLTGTTPNRLHLWSGKIRHEQNENSPAKVLNENADHQSEVAWRTFPELLEDAGISWKIYQNELYLDVGLSPEAAAWLANFGDNPLEYFTQFHVRFAPAYRQHLDLLAESLPRAIESRKSRLAQPDLSPRQRDQLAAELSEMSIRLANVEQQRSEYSAANFTKLTDRQKSIHTKAFCTNSGDPFYHELETLAYQDGDTERTMQIPKGDLFHQFRKDVDSGKLPTVSWIVAPERFSDHPSSAWYGAWYLAECFNILTRNPEIWKKTVFILTYDENDGYFDHIPPFVAPHPRRQETGRVSADIDASVEYVTLEQDLKSKPVDEARESALGLGYRVPMIIASPWTRGGCVCSQVFDHTSPIRFIETLLSRKLGREIKETNISQWRRTVCGDLTSAFQSEADSRDGAVPYAARAPFLEGIHKAQFGQLPSGFKELTRGELESIRKNPLTSPLRPRQEPGVRRSCPLPYELAVDGQLSQDRSRFVVRFQAGNQRFGARAAGAPFIVYFRDRAGERHCRNFAVSPGDAFEDSWLLADCQEGAYDFEVHGPNGFYRRFRGSPDEPALDIVLDIDAPPDRGNLLRLAARFYVTSRETDRTFDLVVSDRSYGHEQQRLSLPIAASASCNVDATSSLGWYDVTLELAGNARFLRHFAGRIEAGTWSCTDPVIGAESR
jgi:phospholipase C